MALARLHGCAGSSEPSLVDLSKINSFQFLDGLDFILLNWTVSIR